jgi:hypothetical protein
MMISTKNLLVAFLALLSASVQAFVPAVQPSSTHRATTTTTTLAALPQAWKDKAAVASAALVAANLPILSAFAIEDDYEYGAVDAPIAVPIIGGILAIGTALLPIALRPGEEAFEEVGFD